VFSRSSDNAGAGTILDAALGLPKDSFTSLGAPAFADDLAYYRGDGVIQARRIDTGTIAWSREGGDNRFAGSLFVVGNVLYSLREDQTLVGLDRRTGKQLWAKRLGSSIEQPSYPYPYGSSTTYDGMAADSAGLLVPTEGRLTALGSGPDKPHVNDPDKFAGKKTHLSAKEGRKDLYYTQKIGIRGTVTRGGQRAADHLELQASTYPYRVWRTVRRQQAYYGEFDFSVGMDRNTRFRVVDVDTAPTKVSPQMRVYMLLRFGLRLYGFHSSSFKLSTPIIAPPWLHVDRRPLYVYRLHSKTSPGIRVGHLDVKRHGGKGHYRARGRVRAHIGRRDYVLVCVPLPQWRQIGRQRSKSPCGHKHI
jgi:hypothetical protein